MSKPKSGKRATPGAQPGGKTAGGDLADIRERIDSIDAQIHALINERARFAQLVGIS